MVQGLRLIRRALSDGDAARFVTGAPGMARSGASLASAERTARCLFYGAKRSEKGMNHPDRSLPRSQEPPLRRRRTTGRTDGRRLSRSKPGGRGKSEWVSERRPVRAPGRAATALSWRYSVTSKRVGCRGVGFGVFPALSRSRAIMRTKLRKEMLFALRSSSIDFFCIKAGNLE